MIQGIPLQTQSAGPHTRGWGCRAHQLLAEVQDHLGHVLTPAEILEHIKAGVRMGYILDNDIPISKSARDAYPVQPCPEWWRVFVRDPAGWILKIFGLKWLSVMRWNWATPVPLDSINLERRDSTSGYLVVEWATSTGSHFGIVEQTPAGLKVVYDPWPGLKRLGVKSIRLETLRHG